MEAVPSSWICCVDNSSNPLSAARCSNFAECMQFNKDFRIPKGSIILIDMESVTGKPGQQGLAMLMQDLLDHPLSEFKIKYAHLASRDAHDDDQIDVGDLESKITFSDYKGWIESAKRTGKNVFMVPFGRIPATVPIVGN